MATGSKLDYRTYAEPLLDILIAGGMLGKIFVIVQGMIPVKEVFDKIIIFL